MTADMLNAFVLTSLEAAMNKALRSDPVTCSALATLEGRIIQILAEDLNQSVYILPFDQGAQLQAYLEGDADVTLSGSSTRLLQLLTSDDKAEHFFGNSISIQGDASLANRFQAVLADMQIDWEALLADAVGDLPAHQIASFGRSQLTFLQQATRSMKANLQEYIQEEIAALPTQPETEHFLQQVDELRERSDRLAARIQRLEEQAETPSN